MGGDGLDHPLHLHEPRTLDQHAGGRGQLGEDLGIEDLRLYDLRHEAISRLVESNKYSFPEMMLITGHKDPKQLMRYTQLRARDLHR